MGTHTAIVSKRVSNAGCHYTLTMVPAVSYPGTQRQFTIDGIMQALQPFAEDSNTLRGWRGSLETRGVLLVDVERSS